VLLADGRAAGGYPKVATGISAARPALGRMTPGAKIAFAAVDIETAEAAARALALEIADLPSRMAPAARKHSIDVDKLLGENLISGAVDARADPRSEP